MKLAKWEEWNGHALDYMAGRRKKKDRPSSIEWMRLASTWSQEFTLFAVTLEDPRADAFMVRLLQYVATHAADTGEIAIPKALFGPVVLSTHWDRVTSETGARVWDALLLHGICTALDLHPGETGRDGTEETEEETEEEAARPSAARPAPTSEAAPAGNGHGSPRKVRRDLRSDVELLLEERGRPFGGFSGVGLPYCRREWKKLRTAGASKEEIADLVAPSTPADTFWAVHRPLTEKYGKATRYTGNGRRGAPEPVSYSPELEAHLRGIEGRGA